MRPCPVCKSETRQVVWRSDFVVPDGWTKPPYLDWNKCECGMIYGDNPDVTQEDYDTYYKERYGYGVVDDDVKYRLAKRASYIRDHFKRASRIVDFGGGESGLKMLLNNIGFQDVTTYGVGDLMPPLADCIIAEHVLEHIYDLESAMTLITNSLKDNGGLIIDIPDAGRMAFDLPAEMPILDYTQVHINHFRINDMLRLCERFGFELFETETYFERFVRSRMFVFYKSADIAGASKTHVITNMATKIEALKELGDKEVILWGAGDIALHCLAHVKPNIQYFVSNDPAFKDATILGLPVKERPDTDHPILIIAQTSKKKLIENIKAMGVTNELIEI
jgi:hypothetical protein